MTTVIVGAGLGGLAAASLLAATNRQVRVLEAKPRCGGRIESVPHSEGSAHGVDLGPTWFWPHQRRMRALCDRLQVRVFEQFDAGAALYQLGPGRIESVQGPAPPSFRVEGGTARLIDALQGTVPADSVACGHRVVKVERSANLWRLTVDANGTLDVLTTASLVVAVPPRVWLQISGVPGCFSAGLNRALAATPTWMAAQARFVATYSHAFWREQGLAGDAFSRVGPMAEVHDASAAAEGYPALFGFLGVPAVARQQLGEERLMALCLDQLVALFGPKAREITGVYLKDWATDPHVATPADLAGAHAHPELDLTPHLDELAELRLSFAVTEAAREEAGYLEGALAAAETAVNALSGAS